MAEDNARKAQYEYNQTSNLVLRPDRAFHDVKGVRYQEEGTGEAQSLAGKLGGRMGDKHRRVGAQDVIDRHKQKQDKRSKADEDVKMDLSKGSGVLGLTSSDMEGLTYRPKTKETRQIYQVTLTFINGLLGNQPHELVVSATDEALVILKDEELSAKAKRTEITEILGSMTEEKYNQLVNLSKKITDFADTTGVAEDEGGMDEEMAIVFADNDTSDEEVVELKDEDLDDDDEGVEADQGEAIRAKQLTNQDAAADVATLQPRDVDAFWLQRELNTRMTQQEAEVIQQMAERVLAILARDIDEHERENELVMELGVDHFEFLSMIQRHRLTILWCTRLDAAGDGPERDAVEREMRKVPELENILRRRILTDAEFEQEEAERREALKLKSVAEATVEDEGGARAMDVGDGQGIATTVPGTRQVVDLGVLEFAEKGRLMTNKKAKIVNGFRTEGKGFEQVTIQATATASGKDVTRIPVSDLPSWAQKAFNFDSLNPVQSKIFDRAFNSNENLLLCAPTGAGKTNVAVLTILQEMKKHLDETTGKFDFKAFKIIYCAPMKSLVSEMVGNFTKRLGEAYGITVGELTGDSQMTKSQLADCQIIVCTPEKYDVITRKGADRGIQQFVRLIIIDEVHLLHDERGPVLEAIIARSIRQSIASQEETRLVGLSATLPNYEDVARLLRVRASSGLFFFSNSFRPVPLEQTFIGVTEKKALKRFQVMNEIVYEKVVERAHKHQVLIFVHSRKETVKTAKAIRDMCLEKDTLGNFFRDKGSHEILKDEAMAVNNEDLRDLLPFGFACHHAGMSKSDRGSVEDLFGDEHVRVLVSTATLAWGVNLPAHTVIIKGTQVYNPEKGRWTELSFLDVLQMFGRAGRPGLNTKGEAILITSHQEMQFYLSLQNAQLPIESQFISKLPDNLNAEIVLGTVANIYDAVEYLQYTYLYYRMMKSPHLYGVTEKELVDDPKLEQRRANLAHSAALILDKSNLIKYDRKAGKFQSTELGRVASHYYVSHTTMDTYNSLLKPTMNDIDLFRVFSLSSEFKNLTIREEEKMELQKLIERVPVPVKESVEDPRAKTNVLLQAYISQLKLDGFALASDMVFITQSAARLVRAIFEIVLRRGWAQLAVKTLELSHMVQRRMWLSMSPLRQFPNIPKKIIKTLEKQSELSWDRFYDLDHRELGEVIRDTKRGKDIYNKVHQFPKLDLAVHVQPVTRALLRVDLTVTADFVWEHSLHGGSESFWIIVEDVDGETILHHELFILKEKYRDEEHQLTMYIPIYEPLAPQYFVRSISDRWLHSQTVLPISFRHLIPPEKNFAPTDLLDLRAVPCSALREHRFERLYAGRFAFFNPIQTQVFNAAYHTDDSILLGAPKGSGKITCAEFAMLRCISQKKKDMASRIVYVVPKASIAEQRMEEWKRFSSLGQTLVMLTGETSTDLKLMKQGTIIVSTPENWDMYSRRWSQRREVMKSIDLFIVDDLQLLGSEAGPILELVCSRMRYLSVELEKSARIFAMSSPLANASDVAEWLGATQGIFNFRQDVRPIPLELRIQGFNSSHAPTRLITMHKPVYTAIRTQGGEKPVIVFVPSRRESVLTAAELMVFAEGEDTPLRFLHCEQSELAGHVDKLREPTLKDCITKGIAYVHSGLTNKELHTIKALFNSGAVQVLIMVQDMCWNMAVYAHLTIIMDTQSYDGREHRYVDYKITDILQMIGFAGREGTDTESKCILMCQDSKKEFFKKFLREPLPVESHIDHYVQDAMNAEVVTRSVENKQDAVDFLTWTFQYKRMSKNPNYYNLQGTSNRFISDHLSEMVENALADLEQSKCLAIEDDFDISPLNLGVIASYYYINYLTVELFSMSLTAKTKIKGLLEIVCAAAEFNGLAVRHREEVVLERLASRVPIKVADQKMHDPHTKANLLLQAHFSRLHIRPEMQQDLDGILVKVLRLLQAIVDVLATYNWLNPAIRAMELSQMVSQAMWNKDCHLKQVPHLDSAAIQRLNEGGVESVFDLMDMEDDERVKALDISPEQLQDVARFCNRFPSLEVTYEVMEKDEIFAGAPVTVKIELDRDDEDEADPGPPICPFFDKKRDENWWIVIGDSASNKLYAIKRVAVKASAKAVLRFEAPEEGTHNLKLYTITDSYLGCDQEFKFEMNVREGKAEESEEDESDDENMKE